MNSIYILGFPQRFDLNTALEQLNILWENIRVRISENDGELHTNMFTTLDDRAITLPRKFLHSDEPVNALVPYLQELLDLNGHEKMIVLMDHNEGDFEILTMEEFQAKLEYPMEEYRANFKYRDGVPIIHPNIEYTWIWVAPKVGKMFLSGDVEDFDENSVCYRSCYGTK